MAATASVSSAQQVLVEAIVKAIGPVLDDRFSKLQGVMTDIVAALATMADPAAATPAGGAALARSVRARPAAAASAASSAAGSAAAGAAPKAFANIRMWFIDKMVHGTEGELEALIAEGNWSATIASYAPPKGHATKEATRSFWARTVWDKCMTPEQREAKFRTAFDAAKNAAAAGAAAQPLAADPAAGAAGPSSAAAAPGANGDEFALD